jgi:hypothetical protein
MLGIVHLSVTHEVTNVSTDRAQLQSMAKQTRTAVGAPVISANQRAES